MSSSLAGRAIMAVALMIGFYLLAVGIAAGLLYIPYAEMVYAHRVHIKIAAICVISALAIIWAVLPRFDKFEAPGPELTREEHPRLFDELDAVARSVGQEMPAEVYMVPDVNAWVMQRGGIMGFSSRRVMGLGLPLMQMLTRSEFRAVLAHEFGHYHGGDTKLGPWIYKTRGTIGRTLASLGDGSLLQIPFHWYGKIFLRITHAVSRRQEFVADELAARAIGSQALIGGLRTVHGVGSAFNAYWSNECAPVLSAGYRPPFAEGFRQFVQAGTIAEAINKQLDEELNSGKSDPYDTHPPLKDRIAAVEHLPAGDPGPEDPAATTLLNDLPSLENRLISSLAGPDAAGKLKPIDWSDVCTQVYLPQWTALVKINEELLNTLTAESIPASTTELKAFGERCRNHDGAAADEDKAEGFGCIVLGAALTVLLVERGGKVDAPPGKSVSVSLGSIEIDTFSIVRSLIEGKVAPVEWQRRCAELGVQGIVLGKQA